MRKIFFSGWMGIFLFAGIATLSGEDFEYPVVAMRILADSRAETCAICVRDLRKKAFAHLDRDFPPGRIIAGLKFTKPSGAKNEFLLTDHRMPILYRKTEKEEIFFPLLAFRFHTPRSKLVGVSPSDYSEEQDARAFDRLSPGSDFTATLKVIRFSYGDGASFCYFPAKNIVQVQCRISDVRPVSKR